MTMRRYPPTTEDICFKYLVGRNSNLSTGLGQNACSSSRTGESHSRQMAEIEHWIKTHRPPCTYGMPVTSVQNNSSSSLKKNSSPKVLDAKQKDSAIKKPLDLDVSFETSPTKKLSTHLTDDDSPKSVQNKYFYSLESPSLNKSAKLNGNAKSTNKSDQKNKDTNGEVSAKSLKQTRANRTSTPVISQGPNIRKNSTKEEPKLIEAKKKINTSKNDEDSEELSPVKSTELSPVVEKKSPEIKLNLTNDSDTSVLTAPYIRSTRNGVSRTKCQSLTRQRASRAQNKFLPTRSSAKRQKEKESINASMETKESSVANNSKLSDSSLDIFGVDLTKESTNSRKSTLRSSSGKLPTLHFSGSKSGGVLKRRSEPVVTRNTAKKALLSTSCHPDLADNACFDTSNNSAQCVSKTDNSAAKVTTFLSSDKEIFTKKKFFI